MTSSHFPIWLTKHILACVVVIGLLRGRGIQNRPPREGLPGHVDYFELKASETLWAQEALLPLPQLRGLPIMRVRDNFSHQSTW